MLIAGEWKLCDDGVTRPVVRANVGGADEIPYAEDFLVDTGADRTVFSATLLVRLRLPTRSPLTGTALSGIGGERVFVMVTTRVEFLNGMITKDKFCCTRWSQLQQSWWRRPLRLRS
jgi:hypothetical protein